MAQVDPKKLVSSLLVVVASLGCKGRDRSADSGQGPPPPVAPQPIASPVVGPARRFDVVSSLHRCDIRHRGHLFDLGSPAEEGLEGWKTTPDPSVSTIEREGASWARVATKQLSFRFVVDEPLPFFVSAKARGIISKSAAINVDGKPAGTLPLYRNQTRVVSSPVLNQILSPGLHTVSLRFTGSSRDGVDPFAELDWVRLGIPDDDPSAYGPPTLADVRHDIALQGLPRRAISLRAPAVVRCTAGFPAQSRLRVSLGLQGNGEGEAELRIVQDGRPAQVLKTIKITGGDRAVWIDEDLPFAPAPGELATLELAATQATRGSRVLFGDPQVVGPDERPPLLSPARAVIVVVLSSVDPSRLPPWAADKPLPTFDTLAREGVVFEHHRSPTTTVSGVVASMLTGLSPRQHSVEDPFSRLPEHIPHLAKIARDASIRTAMFTANPQTFAAFGFARGWDRFTAYSPVSPTVGTAPIDDLISWLVEQNKTPSKGLLAVAHTRGIHPPYDVTPGEFAQMPPEGYSGPLDPRRMGQILERLRTRKRGPQIRYTEADSKRMGALCDNALVQTDRSLSNLLDALRKTGLYNDTLLIVTSDVASAVDPTVLPFAQALDLTEDNLRLPLYVRFPGGEHAGRRVEAPTTAVDIAQTALSALGLDHPGEVGGADLRKLLWQDISAIERPLGATLADRYATRWGNLRLSGKDGSPPQLCDIAADPRCEKDLRDQMPLATDALFRFSWDYEALGRKPPFVRPRREPATIDEDTAAALAVWGR